jgi:hypothetical protein
MRSRRFTPFSRRPRWQTGSPGAHRGKRGHAQDRRVERRDHHLLLLAEEARVGGEGVPLRDELARCDVKSQEAATVRADPLRAANGDLVGGRLRSAVHQAQRREHVPDATDGVLHDRRLHLPDLAALLDDRRATRARRRPPERALRADAVDDELRSEDLREPARPGIAEVGADVGEVRPAHGRGMEVDAVVGTLHDLVEDRSCHPAREAPRAGAGEAPVEVAPVGQVAGVALERQDVHDRDEDDGPAPEDERLVLQQRADGSGPVDLVAVERAADEDHRPVLRTPAHVEGDPDGHPAGALADVEREVLPLPGSDARPVPLSDRRLLAIGAWLRREQRHGRPPSSSAVGRASIFGRRSRRVLFGTRSRMASSFPKQRSRSPASISREERGFGTTEVPR